jgi:hypothetical protein
VSERRLTLAEAGSREFVVIEPGACYGLACPGVGVSFELDRLAWSKHELSGELLVRCEFEGTDGIRDALGSYVLSVARFNVSSGRARTERAVQLERQSRATDVPWHPLIEELCQRVLAAERTGEPAIALADVQPSSPEDTACLDIFGFSLPRRHSTIVFGDGGATKSLLALYLAGLLAQRGLRVLLADWEMDAIDHRDRYASLFGEELPATVYYTRCNRPLIHEADRLQRIVRAQRIDFAINDSVGFACHEAPETAAAALGYFQAKRRIGIGGIDIAHIARHDQGDQRPFGSAFWHNSARATYFLRAAEDATPKTVGVFCRKHSIARYLPRPFAYEVRIEDERTTFRRTEVTDVPELSQRLSVRQRMRAALQRGSLTAEELAEALEVPVNTVYTTARRGTEGAQPWLVKIPGADGKTRLGLLVHGSGHVQ